VNSLAFGGGSRSQKSHRALRETAKGKLGMFKRMSGNGRDFLPLSDVIRVFSQSLAILLVGNVLGKLKTEKI
jgi:hypothetical protein